jgi:hypothetical protein
MSGNLDSSQEMRGIFDFLVVRLTVGVFSRPLFFHHYSREIGDHVIILAKYGIAQDFFEPFSTIGRR